MRHLALLLILASLAGCAARAEPPPAPAPKPIAQPSVKPAAPRPSETIGEPAPLTEKQFREFQELLREEIRKRDAQPLPAAPVAEVDNGLIVSLEEIHRKLDLLLQSRDPPKIRGDGTSVSHQIAKDLVPPKEPERRLLIFTASWCGPCHLQDRDAVQPLRKGLGMRPGPVVLIQVIDVDKEKALAAQYGVTSLPTSVGLVSGKEVGRLTRAATKPEQLADLVGAGE